MSRDALVVGINTYESERLKNLTAPAEDAEAIAQLLTEYGDFKVRRLPAVEQEGSVRVGRKTKVSLTKLEDALVQLFKPEGNNIPDTALLFFSGHGLRKDKGIQEGFLATSDVNPDLGLYGLSLQWLRRLLQESPIRQQIIWLDCCHSGELLNFAEADPGDRGKGRDRCFIAASREFETAYASVGGSHSVLTEVLLQGLDPKQHSAQRVTNYTLIASLEKRLQAFPQSPVFTNSGGSIQLTRTRKAPKEESSKLAVNLICPYKGLEYFDCTEEDAKFFYGRTALTDQLLDKVRLGNFLAVLGASGSGKSSVVRAGLLYQLRLGRRLSESDQWQIRIFQPGEHPLQSLARTFVNSGLTDIDRATQLSKAEELIGKGAIGLGQLITAADTKRVVLLVDQFEEAFTLCKNLRERQLFFECLLGALAQTRDKFCLVLTMRADFFGKCVEQDYSGLSQLIQQHLVTVTPMTPEELQQAIVEPAKQVELEIEPELVSEMLTDVAEAPGSLPLLQYTLTELWKQRRDNCLRLNTYAQLGGVMGTLRKRATEVYESFKECGAFSKEQQQAAVKHIFLSLTQLGEGTEDTRRRVRKLDLVNEHYPEALVNEVVGRLADEKLIVTSEMEEKGEGRVAVVDVAHEALIRHWSLLRKWIDENRDKLRQKRKIEASAEEWRNYGKAKDYLLQGKLLKDAKAFQKESTRNLALSNLAEEFIQKSIRQRRNNRVKLIGLGLIVPLGLAIYLGIAVEEATRIRQLWQTVYSLKGEGEVNNQTRIQALEELVRLRVSLANGKLSGADLRGADLRGAFLIRADLRGAFLRGADLRGATLSRTNLRGANLIQADLSDADLSDADLRGANLSLAFLIQADLSDANLRRADLRGATLNGADLRGADLRGSNLRGADLRGSNLRGADLRDANLRGADLDCWYSEPLCTDLSGAKNLTLKQVQSTNNWQQATYDEEFRKQLGLK